MTARMAEQAEQVRTIMTAGDRLDDITRARMWSAIEDHVSAPAPAARPSRWMRTTAIALGAVAAAAAAILVVRARGASDTDQLTVAADATLTHRLGPHARAALVGPARLELLGPAGAATSARLHGGTLLAEFDGGPGRSLRIEAGDLVAEVVGTLFAIEVTGQHACVAVAHGTVRVTRHGASQLVTDRQQLCSGDPTPHALPDAAAEQLARHERALELALAPSSANAAPTTASPPGATESATASAPREQPQPTTTPRPSVTASAPREPSQPTTTPRPSVTASAPREPSQPTTTPRPSVTASAPREPSQPATTPRPSVTASAPREQSQPTTTPRPSVTASAPREPQTAPGPSVTASAPREPAQPATTPRPSVTASVPPEPQAQPATTPRTSVTANPPRETAPSSPAPAPPSAEELYRAAEVALAAGDRAAAVRALTSILTLPDRPLADQARYELARIEYQRRAWTAARAHLAALAAIAGSPLAEPGRYLDCRIAVEAKATDAERCFTGYRSAYPRSPHDLDVLAVLVQLAHARAGCDGARALRDELIGRYPRTDHAAAWRSRCKDAP